MTFSERERVAYITGDTETAALLGELEDQEGLEEAHEEALGEARKEGKLEASDKALLADIARLEARVHHLEERRSKLLATVRGAHDWLRGDTCKNAKGRREFERGLQHVIIQLRD